jgi:hypothetical protein
VIDFSKGGMRFTPPDSKFIIAGTDPPIYQISGGSPVVDFTDSATLFIEGMSSGTDSSPMNLFIEGGNSHTQKWAPLYIQNDFLASDEEMTLYIEGTGGSDGFFPFNSNMNLFIKRGPNAGITLFICNNRTPETMPLFISGSVPIHTTLTDLSPHTHARYGLVRFHSSRYGPDSVSHGNCPTLFISGYGGTTTGDVDLFINGNVPTGINDQVTLVIPEVVGRVSGSPNLYIHGFIY